MEIILSCNTVILYPDKTHKLYYVLLLDIMVGMGYSQEEIQESLSKMKYDEITATYLLLGRKSSELDASDSSSSSNLSLAKVRPSSDLNNSTGQSPHHKVQRSVSSSQKQRRYSDHAGPAIPSVVAYPKRSQTSTADSDLKEDGIPSRKSSGSAVGGKGIAPASPMLGNASNPNKADIPERKKSSTVPSSNTASGGMTRRNTYVCSERTTADRHSVIQNGKENRYEILPVCKKICFSQKKWKHVVYFSVFIIRIQIIMVSILSR